MREQGCLAGGQSEPPCAIKRETALKPLEKCAPVDEGYHDIVQVLKYVPWQLVFEQRCDVALKVCAIMFGALYCSWSGEHIVWSDE